MSCRPRYGLDERTRLPSFSRLSNKSGAAKLLRIDRAPIEREWQKPHCRCGRSSTAQPMDLRSRLSSRRRLPELISRLGVIDIFVHDSLHSERNVRFEMDQVFAVLRPGGAIVVDDIDVIRGLCRFTQWFTGFDAFVCEADPLRPDFGRHNKKGLFGIIIKASRPEG
jgi:hypothetical protein